MGIFLKNVDRQTHEREIPIPYVSVTYSYLISEPAIWSTTWKFFRLVKISNFSNVALIFYKYSTLQRACHSLSTHSVLLEDKQITTTIKHTCSGFIISSTPRVDSSNQPAKISTRFRNYVDTVLEELRQNVSSLAGNETSFSNRFAIIFQLNDTFNRGFTK